MSTGNVFITPLAVARDAAIALANRLVVGNLIARKTEQEFAKKVGSSVTVTVPPIPTEAREFDGETHAEAVEEREVKVDIEKHFYKRVNLTTAERTFKLSDFTRLITIPHMTGISMSVDKYLLDTMRRGFAPNVANNPVTRPSSYDHVLLAGKALDDQYMPMIGRVGVVDTQTRVNLLKLAEFKSRDYVDVPGGGQTNLGNLHGIDWYMDASAGSSDRGDIGGTVTASGTENGTVVQLAAFTQAAGVIRKGTSFTIAGDTTRYTTLLDAVIDSNAATVVVTPALAATASSAEVTFEAEGYQNLVYHPNAVAGAIVAPEPLMGGNSAIATYHGVSVRVSFDSSITTLNSGVVYDVYVGANVVQPEAGVVFGGT